MKLDFRRMPFPRDQYRIINLDTGDQISFCAWVDEEAGEYGQWSHKAECRPDLVPNFAADGSIPIVAGKARLKVEKLAPDDFY